MGQLYYGLYVPRRVGVQVTGLVVDWLQYITGHRYSVKTLYELTNFC